MDSHTKTSQRVIIWIIAITMSLGFLGSYFLIIIQNDEQKKQQAASQQQPVNQPKDLPVDPTAFKTTAPVTALEKTDLSIGSGDEVKLGDTISVHYKGTFAQTGQKFESSYDTSQPAELKIAEGSLIQGWVEGIPGMKVGGKRRLVIPSSMAYGPQGSMSIPGNTDLVFEVEIMAIKPAAQ